MARPSRPSPAHHRVPLRRAREALRSRPNRRAAVRRGAAVLVAVAVMTVAVGSHRRGLELADRWGTTSPVVLVESPVTAGERLRGRVRVTHVPSFLAPQGHLAEVPAEARAATALSVGEILTSQRVQGGDGSPDDGPGHRRALVPVPLQGREGAAPSQLAVGDVVDVIAPGAHTPSGGRDAARTVARRALVRSVDADAVTLEVSTPDVAPLADALLGGPVVLAVVGAATAPSAAGGGDVVDDE